MARCGGCDTTWTGLSIAHCAAEGCHETFTTVSNFDRHQVSAGAGLRVCADPAERGLVRNSRGQWHGPGRDADSRGSGMTQGDETGSVGIRCRDGLS